MKAETKRRLKGGEEAARTRRRRMTSGAAATERQAAWASVWKRRFLSVLTGGGLSWAGGLKVVEGSTDSSSYSFRTMKGSCWGSTGLFLVTQVRIQYIDVALLSTGQHRSSSSRL